MGKLDWEILDNLFMMVIKKGTNTVHCKIINSICDAYWTISQWALVALTIGRQSALKFVTSSDVYNWSFALCYVRSALTYKKQESARCYHRLAKKSNDGLEVAIPLLLIVLIESAIVLDV